MISRGRGGRARADSDIPERNVGQPTVIYRHPHLLEVVDEGKREPSKVGFSIAFSVILFDGISRETQVIGTRCTY